ncbi:MAG: hypothetical protein QOC69_3115, partial [Mycobacterium sp.]|nr:hypothetical protein [Mycobacterium sp.]
MGFAGRTVRETLLRADRLFVTTLNLPPPVVHIGVNEQHLFLATAHALSLGASVDEFEPLDGADEEPGSIDQPLIRVRSPEAGGAFEKMGKRDANFEAGEARSKAVVRTETECDVRVRVSIQDQLIRPREDLLVPVGTPDQHDDVVGLRDREARDLDVL